MPLKLVRRQGSDIWYLRGTVRGIRIFESAGTGRKEQAEAVRAQREAELFQESVFGKRSVVSFSAAALSYLEFEERGTQTGSYVNRLVEHFGDTLVSKIDQLAVDQAATKLYRDAAPATKLRSVYTPATAVLNYAADRGWCERRRFHKPSPPKGKTRWLSPSDAAALLDASAKHLRPLLHFMLCTGARVSEALDLEWSEVDLLASTVVFRDTKNGTDRAAALPAAGILLLANLPGDRAGHVFRRADGEPYADKGREGGGQMKTGWRGACRRAGIENASPHDLRHTWATWFYALTRDPLLLKAEGGWKSLALVERYAHLAPLSIRPEIAKVWGTSHPRIGALPGAEVGNEKRA